MNIKDSLIEALGNIGSEEVEVMDAFDGERKPQSLEEHDKQHHHGHFDPNTQTCKLREKIGTETETDKGDELDIDKGKGRKGEEPPADGGGVAVTPQEDAEYMEAAEKGDIATIERIEREVAARMMPNTKVVDKKGRPMVVYHGTVSKEHFKQFNERPIYAFHREGLASQYTNPRRDLWVSPNQTGRVMPVFMNLENPLVVDANKHLWRNIQVDWSNTPVSSEDIVKYAKENGYDGVILKRVRDNIFDDDRTIGNEYIAFSSNQVKSTGATYKSEHIGWGNYGDKIESLFGPTHDDEGNIIPLSKRFNMKGNDIRFSVSGTGKKGVKGEKTARAKNEDEGEDIRGEVGSEKEENGAEASQTQSSRQITDTLGKDINSMTAEQADAVINDFYQGYFSDRDWADKQEEKVKRFGKVNVGKTKRFVAAALKELSAKYPKIKEVLSNVEFIPAPYGDTKKAYIQAACGRKADKNNPIYAMMMGWGEVSRYGYNWADQGDLPTTVADRGANVLMSNRAVLMHEIGHIFQFSYDNNKEWDRLVRKDKTGWTKQVSDYGSSSRDELHSECLAYYTMPEYKRGTFPPEVEVFLETELKG